MKYTVKPTCEVNTMSDRKRSAIEPARAAGPPLRFIPNPADASFTACCNGKKLLFEKDRIAIFRSPQPDCPCVALRFVGASKNAPEGFLPVGGFSAREDGKTCCETLPAYGMLKYANVWEGVDLELSACETGLKMNWVLAAPKYVSAIRLRWEGALSLELDGDGALLIRHAQGILKDAPPAAWQVQNADVSPIPCAYRLWGGSEVGFALSACDEGAPVVIDPLLS